MQLFKEITDMYAAKTNQATRNHDLCGHENKPPHALHNILPAVPLPALFQEHYFILVQHLNLLLNSEVTTQSTKNWLLRWQVKLKGDISHMR